MSKHNGHRHGAFSNGIVCCYFHPKVTDLFVQVATFIIQKILIDDMGLKYVTLYFWLVISFCFSYICHTYERFDTVSTVLRSIFVLFVVIHLRFQMQQNGEKPTIRALTEAYHSLLFATV